MKIGAMELVLVFIVALLVIGPDKLPLYARKFGNALRAFREASSDITQEFRESVVEPLEEAQKPLREAMEPLEEIDREIRENVKGVERDLNNLGKKSSSSAAKNAAEEEIAATDNKEEDICEPSSEVTAENDPSGDPASAASDSCKDIDAEGKDSSMKDLSKAPDEG